MDKPWKISSESGKFYYAFYFRSIASFFIDIPLNSPFIVLRYLCNFTAARLKINEEFKKNKNEASEENISKVKHPTTQQQQHKKSFFVILAFSSWQYEKNTTCVLIVFFYLQMIKMGSSVETVLRKAVIQVEHVAEDRICGYHGLIPLCFTKINHQCLICFFFFFNSASAKREPHARKCAIQWHAKE